jgi:hypothetical protein
MWHEACDVNRSEVNARFESFPQIKALRELIKSNLIPGPLTDAILKQLLDHAGTLQAEFEYVIENQRGLCIFGFPLFSGRSLIPMVDPPSFQLLNGGYVLQAVEKNNNYESVHSSLAALYPLPDFNWEWSWDSWYVFMLYDVDDQGWIYLNLLFSSKHWRGRDFFGSCVRRRIWVRLRNIKGYQVGGHQHDQGSDVLKDVDESVHYECGDTIYVGSTEATKRRKRSRLGIK